MLYGSCALLDSEQNTSEALHVFLEMHEMHFFLQDSCVQNGD